MPRLPELDPARLSDAQRQVYDKIASGPRGGVRGPFIPLLQSPAIADHIQALGGALRFDGVLPGRLRELAILVTARFWTAQFEWQAHARIAETEGIDKAVIMAIAERRVPDLPSPDDQAIYAFCRELHEGHRVSDETFAKTVDVLGPEGVVELVVLTGYYTLISMVLDTFEVEPPAGAGSRLED